MTHHRQDRTNDLWTDGAILRESERWVHVPPSGVRVKDAGRLLVHLPAQRGASRVWRSRPDRTGAEALILQTIDEARAAGGTRLVWHTGDAVFPPFMDDLLPQNGFEKTEDLDVLAFELGTDPEPRLPGLRVPAGVRTQLVNDEADLRRANAVEAAVFPASTWDESDTRLPAGNPETRRPPADAHRPRRRLARPPVSGLRPGHRRRWTRDRRDRRRRGRRRDGPLGARERSPGTGAGVLTAPW